MAALVLAPSGDSIAAPPPKVDLTPYLDGFPQVGDFRFYNRDDGASKNSVILEAVDQKKLTDLLVETTEAGDVQQEVDEVVHGKEERIGNAYFGDLVFVIGKPKRVESFLVVPGRPLKYKIAFKVLYQGKRAGKGTLTGATTFVGFESIDTPAFGHFDQVAHMHRDQTITVKVAGVGGSILTTVSSSDSWDTLELGAVRGERVTRSYLDGALQQTFGPYTYLFDHGQYQGVPFP